MQWRNASSRSIRKKPGSHDPWGQFVDASQRPEHFARPGCGFATKTERNRDREQVASKASVMKKGRNWVISASGGVLINSYVIADKTQQSDAPAKAKSAAGTPDKTNWRWN